MAKKSKKLQVVIVAIIAIVAVLVLRSQGFLAPYIPSFHFTEEITEESLSSVDSEGSEAASVKE